VVVEDCEENQELCSHWLEYQKSLPVEWKFILKCVPWLGSFWKYVIGLIYQTHNEENIRSNVYAALEGLQTVVVEMEALLTSQSLIHFLILMHEITPASWEVDWHSTSRLHHTKCSSIYGLIESKIPWP